MESVLGATPREFESRILRRSSPLAGVLISHGHYDHFDLAAFAAYPDKSVPMLVERGLADAARRHGFTSVTELAPWESAAIGPVRVTATPAEHKVPEITFVLDADTTRVFFGADTCTSRSSTAFPADSATSTWHCCRSTAWRSGPCSTGRSS